MPAPSPQIIDALETAYAALIAQDKEFADARAALQNADPRPTDAIEQIVAIDAERRETGKRIVENRNLYIQAREASPDLAKLLDALQAARRGAQSDAARIRKVTTNAGKTIDVLEQAATQAPRLQNQVADALDKIGAFLGR